MGLALEACGDNETMVRASSIILDKMKNYWFRTCTMDLFPAHKVTLYLQQGYADITSGIGMMVIGLASIIIGLTFIKSDKVATCLVGTIVGAILYRFALTIALYLGLPFRRLKDSISIYCCDCDFFCNTQGGSKKMLNIKRFNSCI